VFHTYLYLPFIYTTVAEIRIID